MNDLQKSIKTFCISDLKAKLLHQTDFTLE